MLFNRIDLFDQANRTIYVLKWISSNGTINDSFPIGTMISEMLNSSDMNLQNESNNLTPFPSDDVIRFEPEPMAILILVTICYSLIFVAGILGNVITCLVIYRNKSMHTATNYYLFNLAVSDLILLLSGECVLCLLVIHSQRCCQLSRILLIQKECKILFRYLQECPKTLIIYGFHIIISSRKLFAYCKDYYPKHRQMLLF